MSIARLEAGLTQMDRHEDARREAEIRQWVGTGYALDIACLLIRIIDAAQQRITELEGERDTATLTLSDLRAVADAARAYRAAESDGTPRMFRGKALQDLANDLDDKIAALSKVEEK